jgi:hypothetical protein
MNTRVCDGVGDAQALRHIKDAAVSVRQTGRHKCSQEEVSGNMARRHGQSLCRRSSQQSLG